MCPDVASNTTWVTDRAGTRDVLLGVRPGAAPGGAAAAAPAWTWPDRPGVDGCAAGGGSLLVGLSGAKAMYALKPTAEGRFVGAPEAVLQNKYGRISGADLASDGMLWIGDREQGPGRDAGADGRPRHPHPAPLGRRLRTGLTAAEPTTAPPPAGTAAW